MNIKIICSEDGTYGKQCVSMDVVIPTVSVAECFAWSIASMQALASLTMEVPFDEQEEKSEPPKYKVKIINTSKTVYGDDLAKVLDMEINWGNDAINTLINAGSLVAREGLSAQEAMDLDAALSDIGFVCKIEQ